MLTWGYARHPRKQMKDSQRIAVRPIQAYPFTQGCWTDVGSKHSG